MALWRFARSVNGWSTDATSGSLIERSPASAVRLPEARRTAPGHPTDLGGFVAVVRSWVTLQTVDEAVVTARNTAQPVTPRSGHTRPPSAKDRRAARLRKVPSHVPGLPSRDRLRSEASDDRRLRRGSGQPFSEGARGGRGPHCGQHRNRPGLLAVTVRFASSNSGLARPTEARPAWPDPN